MGQSNTRVVTAHLPIEMAEKLDLLATSYDRSRGGGEEGNTSHDRSGRTTPSDDAGSAGCGG